MTDQPEGMSTDKIGKFDCLINFRMVWKGARTGGSNENPGVSGGSFWSLEGNDRVGWGRLVQL